MARIYLSCSSTPSRSPLALRSLSDRSPFHNLHVSKSAQLNGDVLQGTTRPVDDEQLEHNVILVHGDQRLRVNGIGESGELVDVVELVGKVRTAPSQTKNVSLVVDVGGWL